jgi:hypothetical protein
MNAEKPVAVIAGPGRSVRVRARRMLPGMLERGRGALLLIGATGSVKARAGFSAFAAGKFALRGPADEADTARGVGAAAHRESATGCAALLRSGGDPRRIGLLAGP